MKVTEEPQEKKSGSNTKYAFHIYQLEKCSKYPNQDLRKSGHLEKLPT